MKQLVQQSGNKMKKGTVGDLADENGPLVTTPLLDKEISLKRVLAKVTAKNIHSETEWGPAVGKEVW